MTQTNLVICDGPSCEATVPAAREPSGPEVAWLHLEVTVRTHRESLQLGDFCGPECAREWLWDRGADNARQAANIQQSAEWLEGDSAPTSRWHPAKASV